MPTLYTVGHSSRTWAEFLEILQAHDITYVIDVRTIPKSRHVPWTNKASLQQALKKAHIGYTHLAALGGLRHPVRDSINDAWENAGFRGFADYMQTPAFFAALKELNAFIRLEDKVTLLCAEAVPWRCHRSLIADAEVVRHVNVLEIMSKTSVREHQLTPFAVVDRRGGGGRIYYPG